ncbi:MAG: hypothetical protein ACYS9V_14090 [Planctomycetota bacterium]|jgi:hypothetical protein
MSDTAQKERFELNRNTTGRFRCEIEFQKRILLAFYYFEIYGMSRKIILSDYGLGLLATVFQCDVK